MLKMHPNNYPNDKCEGCLYWQQTFCNYPFDQREELRWGCNLGTHYCTAYGNRYYIQRHD